MQLTSTRGNYSLVPEAFQAEEIRVTPTHLQGIVVISYKTSLVVIRNAPVVKDFNVI